MTLSKKASRRTTNANEEQPETPKTGSSAATNGSSTTTTTSTGLQSEKPDTIAPVPPIDLSSTQPLDPLPGIPGIIQPAPSTDTSPGLPTDLPKQPQPPFPPPTDTPPSGEPQSSLSVDNGESQGELHPQDGSYLQGGSHPLEVLSIQEANARLQAICLQKTMEAEYIEPPVSSGASGTVDIQVKPNFRLRWGDGPDDRIETDDTEVLCVEASNPYTDVTIKNLTVVMVGLTIDDKLPALLPDETPSVAVTPLGMINFGDLPSANGDSATVSREIFLTSRGAKAGEYKIELYYTFALELEKSSKQGFKVHLVRS